MPRYYRWGFVIIGVVVLGLLVARSLGLWLDYLWFDSVGYKSVFLTRITARVQLFLVFGVVLFVWLFAHLRWARRRVPREPIEVGRRLLPAKEREQIEKHADKYVLLIAVVLALGAGLLASGQWANFLQYRHAVPFEQTDPVFGKDYSFYVFKLGFLQYLNRYLFNGCMLVLVCSGLIYVYEEALRFGGGAVYMAAHARRHLLLLGAMALLVKAWAYRLRAFTMMFSQHGDNLNAAGSPFTIREGAGPYYADINGALPALTLLVVASIACAAVLLFSMRRESLKLPVWALGILVLLSVLGGVGAGKMFFTYPGLVQRLVVEPTEFQKEQQYIRRNIDATKFGFGLEQVTEDDYSGMATLTARDIAANPTTIDNIRLWDDRPLEKTFNSVQELRRYYDFVDVDIDRYRMDGEYRQVMLSARQLDERNIPPQWVVRHLHFTHGFGLVMSPVNQAGPEGLPTYFIKDIPPIVPDTLPPGYKETLDVTEPRLYYMAWIKKFHLPAFKQQPTGPGPGGEGAEAVQPETPEGEPVAERVVTPHRSPPDTEDYVLVNTTEPEFDYPVGSENMYTHYAGTGGVPISSFWRRLALFSRFTDVPILFTGSLKKGSKVLLRRWIALREQAIAPFIIPDPDPYLVVHKGRLVWLMDAYTLSAQIPYAAALNLGQWPINYMRNSVKVTVDAYDGAIDFYVFDEKDPIVRTWQKIFPDLFKPRSAMPPGLVEHVRYPQFMFMCQSIMFADYHMDESEKVFFNREDRWSLPVELYQGDKVNVEPYFVVMRLPGEKREEFIQMLPMTPAGKADQNMIAWIAGRCDGEHYGKLMVFLFPKDKWFTGPMQMENRIDQDTAISREMSLWGTGGSVVLRGNLLIIPIDDSLLYVEPVFLEARRSEAGGGSGIPELKRVIVGYKDRLTMQPTLDEALEELFGTAEPRPPTPGVEPVEPAPAPPGAEVVPEQLQRITPLIRRAIELEREADALLRAGDLAGFDTKRKELRGVLADLENLTQ